MTPEEQFDREIHEKIDVALKPLNRHKGILPLRKALRGVPISKEYFEASAQAWWKEITENRPDIASDPKSDKLQALFSAPAYNFALGIK